MTQWGLDTLFNPAKRHMDEEKRRLQATRQQVGDTSGGKRIDLESGKVRIKPPNSEDETADDAGTDEAVVDEAGDAAADAADDAKPGARPAAKKADAKPAAEKKTSAAKKELTPAQLRAAQRRGRAPH